MVLSPLYLGVRCSLQIRRNEPPAPRTRSGAKMKPKPCETTHVMPTATSARTMMVRRTIQKKGDFGLVQRYLHSGDSAMLGSSGGTRLKLTPFLCLRSRSR